jgi:hypothetical protein
MNHYPKWWNTTITLYNKFTDNELKKVVWYRHVIDGCFYKHDKESIMFSNTKLVSDVSVCRIPVSDKFKGRREWLKLSDDERYSFFTFGTGDIIVVDEVDFEIDERIKGRRSSDLIQEYSEWPGCFIIETVNVNVGGGRGNEHYHVRGK